MARSTLALLALVLLTTPALAGCLSPTAEHPDEAGTRIEAVSAKATRGSEPATSPGTSSLETGTGDDTGGVATPHNETGNETQADDTPHPPGTGIIYPGGDPATTYVLGLSMMRWSKTDLSVLIIPPGYTQTGQNALSPMDSLFLRAVEDSIVHWQEAITAHGSTELRGNISFDVQVLGRDGLTLADVTNADILIGNPPGGIVLGGFAYYGLSPRCVIGNFALPTMDYTWMFGVSAHEFGHCLGMSHPDDHEPWFDLMSYSWMNQPADADDLALDCVSNLNLMAVHEAFAPAYGRQAQGPVSVTADAYFLLDCAARFLETL